MNISPHRQLAKQAGMTLLEIMIVLAIMGMGMAFFVGGSLFKSDSARLREASVEVLVTLRAAHNMATMTGKHHRVVFDLEHQNYHIEVCEGALKIKRGDTEEVVDKDELEKLREKLEHPAMSSASEGLIESDSPEQAMAAAAALAGLRIGTTTCKPALNTLSGQRATKGNRHILDVKRGISIEEIHVQHLQDPATEGVVSINFFPVGSAEKAVIKVAGKDGEARSILLFGMTARVDTRPGDFDADKHMRRNGVGDEVKP